MVGSWLCESCYCVVASESDFDFGVFEQVCDFVYVGKRR